MSSDFNQVLHDTLLDYATNHNDITSLTFDVVSTICRQLDTHIENEEVTLAQLYINIARALVLPNMDFPIENRKKLDCVKKALTCYDVVKLQKFNDVAFTPLYEDCVINALTKFNMTAELYNELHTIQREYGLSASKAKEIENQLASEVLTSLIDEVSVSAVTKENVRVLYTFKQSLKYELSQHALANYTRFMKQYSYLIKN